MGFKFGDEFRFEFRDESKIDCRDNFKGGFRRCSEMNSGQT